MLYLFTDEESEEKLALSLLVPLFTAKSCDHSEMMGCIYEKGLVSFFYEYLCSLDMLATIPLMTHEVGDQVNNC
jgi:hypothetical protein